MATQVARFCATYPGMYTSPAWPTRDGVIPWRLFHVLYGQLDSVLSLQHALNAEAVALGAGVAFGSDKAVAEIEKIGAVAFPEGEGQR